MIWELFVVCSWIVDRINLGSVSQILFAFPVYSGVYMVLRDNVLCFGPVGIVFLGLVDGQ